MLFVTIACVVIAGLFCALWVGARRSLADSTRTLEMEKRQLAAAEARNDELDAQLTESEGERSAQAERIAEMTDTTTEQADRLTDLEAAIESAETEVAELRADLDAKTSSAAELDARLSASASELEQRGAEITELTHQTETLQEELAAADDAAAKRRDIAVPPVLMANSDDGDRLDLPGFSPATAWELELVRSERTWRYSVSSNPLEDPSPFDDTDTPLRLAIEVEALALREDVGAFIGINWQVGDLIDPAVDPARAHLILRLAQEMLAAAAREVEPSELVVSAGPSGAGVSIQIVPVDGDVDFNIPPPPIASEWIDIDEHGGMVVTVRTDASTSPD